MEHVVFFPTRDGGASFRRLPSFEEAVRLVEHLRNVEGVEQVSVHTLTEVPLNFRAYYRVEVPSAWGSGPQAAPPVPEAPGQLPAATEHAHAAAPAEQAPAAPASTPESIALERAGESLTLVPAEQEPNPADDGPAETAPAENVPVESVRLAPEPDSTPAPALVESVPVQASAPDDGVAASNGRSRSGGSSLGFFA